MISANLDADAGRWPRFVAGAGEAGFRSAHALPMRLRDEVIGVLNLLHTDPHSLDEPDRRLGQALADAATIGLLHERAVRRAETAREQLQEALNSRVIIEQAKGRLAQQGNLCVEDAFTIPRSHARNHHLRLTQLCRDVVEAPSTSPRSSARRSDRPATAHRHSGRHRGRQATRRRRAGGEPERKRPGNGFAGTARASVALHRDRATMWLGAVGAGVRSGVRSVRDSNVA